MFEDDDIKVEEDEVDTGAWLDTYADAITLLMCFFVLLYATSNPDSEKMDKLATALQNQLNGNPYLVEQIMEGEVPYGDIIKTEYDMLLEQVQGAIKNNGLEGTVGVREEADGVVLQLGDSTLFDSGKADLKQESKEMLDKVGVLLKDLNKRVIIDGNTDDVPMNSGEFKSNWELSLYRALNVLDYLTSTVDLDVSKYSAKGSGEFNPLVPNDSAKNRAINRRVDILIVQPRDEIKANTKEGVENVQK